VAVDLHLLTEDLPRTAPDRLFDNSSLAIAENSDGAAVYATDFQPGPSGFVRILVANRTMSAERAGALVGFHTDDGVTDSRWFFRAAALSVRAGMSREGALKALTINNAKMLDLDARVGSLKAGKDADFPICSGDPLSVYTHLEETWVQGRRVFDRANPVHRKYATGGLGASHDSADPTWILALEAEEL